MALTLIESSKIAMGRDEVIKAAIMELYARNSDLMMSLPFETISGNALTFQREQTLPSVGFRGVNEAFDESTGKTDKITESLAIAGGDLDVDKFIVDTGGPGQRQIQEAMKIKSLALSMTKELIKGDVTSDHKSFDGLQLRLLGNQRISAGVNGTTSGTLSLHKLDELIDAVEDPTALLMNKSIRRRMATAARTTGVGGYITYTLDQFGRRVTEYNSLPILIVDKDETNTDIMAFNETTPGGGATGCSVYCLSFSENGVMGLQGGEMEVRDLGEIDTKPVLRTRVEWYISLVIYRPRAAARLWGIMDKAIEA
ncbi:MAG TPA: hypothetical protein VMW95_06610 [Desulfobacterales bacterium]|nr:hypothetical protein [Desulfobacterales bacterium]